MFKSKRPFFTNIHCLKNTLSQPPSRKRARDWEKENGVETSNRSLISDLKM